MDKANQFFRVPLSYPADIVVFGNIPFVSARIQILSICSSFSAEYNRKSLYGPVMLKRLFGTETFSVQENGTEFERGVVRDSESPVG